MQSTVPVTQPGRDPGGIKPGGLALIMLLSLTLGTAAGFLISRLRDNRTSSANQQRIAELERRIREMRAGRSTLSAPADPGRAAANRKSLAGQIRRDYATLLPALRTAVGISEQDWPATESLLKNHFEPMEQALQAFEKTPGWNPPDLREVMAPHVPPLLNALRAILSPEQWQKFEQWRRPAAASAEVWRSPRYAYFLTEKEYTSVSQMATAALRWSLLRDEVYLLAADMKLKTAGKRELEMILREHLNGFTAIVGGPGRAGLKIQDAPEKMQELVSRTCAEVKNRFGSEGLQVFEKWYSRPGSRAARYFRVPPAGPPE